MGSKYMSFISQREALIALNMTQGMGAITAKRLIEHFGSAVAALSATADDLAAVHGIGLAKAERFVEEFRAKDPVAEENHARKCGARIVCWDDPDYPASLKSLYDPPLALYVCGDCASFSRTGVAIIGTRNATRYGLETAFNFGYRLASAGYSVISGMARGIDGEGHRGAVEASGITIGVLGGALDRFYPEENRKLARKVVEGGGAIISEYPFGRTPDRQTFPMRNRIVSGLSSGVLVVEAAMASGTLITVDQALEQGKPVMAIPGRIDSATSQGCHKLIRNGARLITCVDDIIEEIEAKRPSMRQGTLDLAAEAPAARSQATPSPTLSDEEERIMAAFGGEDRFIDELADATGIDAGRLNGLLVALQLKRLVKILPGGMAAPAR
ncbi:MAG: DNA-processing protein DprA [Kiritimatiellae bacterium]|nr:DNA-processing protein DprA [Kiritimatiellia bacterium]